MSIIKSEAPFHSYEDKMGQQFRELERSEKFMYLFLKEGNQVLEYCKNSKDNKVTESVKKRDPNDSNGISTKYRSYEKKEVKKNLLSLMNNESDSKKALSYSE